MGETRGLNQGFDKSANFIVIFSIILMMLIILLIILMMLIILLMVMMIKKIELNLLKCCHVAGLCKQLDSYCCLPFPFRPGG